MTTTAIYKYNTYIATMQSVLEWYTLENIETALMMVDLARHDDPEWICARLDLQAFITDYIISGLGA